MPTIIDFTVIHHQQQFNTKSLANHQWIKITIRTGLRHRLSHWAPHRNLCRHNLYHHRHSHSRCNLRWLPAPAGCWVEVVVTAPIVVLCQRQRRDLFCGYLVLNWPIPVLACEQSPLTLSDHWRIFFGLSSLACLQADCTFRNLRNSPHRITRRFSQKGFNHLYKT